jgi:hypothetical protein
MSVCMHVHACMCDARQGTSLFVAGSVCTVFKALTLDRALSAEQMACMIVMGLWLGGPLFFFFTPLLLCLFGTGTQLCYFLVVALVLALHPLPNMEEYLNKSTFSMWLCTCLCFCLPLLMSALAPFLRVLRLPLSLPCPLTLTPRWTPHRQVLFLPHHVVRRCLLQGAGLGSLGGCCWASLSDAVRECAEHTRNQYICLS